MKPINPDRGRGAAALTQPRFRWPKTFPPLTADQKIVSDDFMKYWHEVLPRKFGAIERFNHTYPLRMRPSAPFRTLEIGAGLGEHISYENLDEQEYHCIELRPAMADAIRAKFPRVNVVTGDCQRRGPFEDAYFDRVLAVHVLEHLPNLPAAIDEVRRVLKPGGLFSIVIPCDPGLAYAVARKISAERLFKRRYRMPYDWFIRREHINSPAEILSVLRDGFTKLHRAYFPLVVPLWWANLCMGLTLRKQPRCALSLTIQL